jgi:hypothetical protein
MDRDILAYHDVAGGKLARPFGGALKEFTLICGEFGSAVAQNIPGDRRCWHGGKQ